MEEFTLRRARKTEEQRYQAEIQKFQQPEQEKPIELTLKDLLYHTLNTVLQSHPLDPNSIEFAQAMELLDLDTIHPHPTSPSKAFSDQRFKLQEELIRDIEQPLIDAELSAETRASIQQANRLASRLILVPSGKPQHILELLQQFLEILRHAVIEQRKIMLDILLKALFMQRLMADFSEKLKQNQEWHEEKLEALQARFKALVHRLHQLSDSEAKFASNKVPEPEFNSPLDQSNSEYNENDSFKIWLEKLSFNTQNLLSSRDIRHLLLKYQEILGLAGS